jgi:hypothetical protein
MNFRTVGHARVQARWAIATVFGLLLSAGFAPTQVVTLSAGPPLLYQVRSIYVVPSADDIAVLLKARLEKWNAIGITSKPEEADAILNCQASTMWVPAKVVVWRTMAEVTLVDRRSQKPIWKTSKATTYRTSGLADDVIEQLKEDWKKSASQD